MPKTLSRRNASTNQTQPNRHVFCVRLLPLLLRVLCVIFSPPAAIVTTPPSHLLFFLARGIDGRPFPPFLTASSSRPSMPKRRVKRKPKFAPGDRVEAKFKGVDDYIEGTVDCINEDGTYSIILGDGDEEPRVFERNIRVYIKNRKLKFKSKTEQLKKVTKLFARAGASGRQKSRKYSSRKTFSPYELLEAATIHIQAAARGYLTRKVQNPRNRGLLKIKYRIKRFKAKWELERRRKIARLGPRARMFLKVNHAATKVQALGRIIVARNYVREYQRRIVRCQSYGRRYARRRDHLWCSRPEPHN